mgnify:CR=1 FL=1
MILPAFILSIFAYLIGSIPTGYILFKLKEKKDIRAFGSRSTGATNILRTSGPALAILVLILDVGKGFLPALLAKEIISSPALGLVCSFLAAVGHCFPVFLGFRGGKGVATSCGVLAVYSWPSLLICTLVFFFIVLITRIVSIGSLAASLLIIPLIYLFHHDPKLMAATSLFTLLIWLRHRDNLKRLWRGEENKIGKKINASN